MPMDPRDPRTLIMEGKVTSPVEVARISNSIFIFLDGKPRDPGSAVGMDEETAVHLSDGLNAVLSKVYDRAISRAIWELEDAHDNREPKLEDL